MRSDPVAPGVPSAGPQAGDRWAAGAVLGVGLFVALAVLGLYDVKWQPYVHKALVAAAKHSLGSSILTGQAAAPPAPSWQAAWGYALAYGKAVWQALVLGLLLGSGVQALLPRTWLVRLLGRMGWGTTALAGALALPSMMCTCCAAPMAVGLRRSRVSPAAALAFWLGNPVLNPAVLVFLALVLGWPWAVLRAVVGVALVLVAAWWGGRLSLTGQEGPAVEALGRAAAEEEADARRPLWLRWLRAFVSLAVGLVPEYAALVLLLGAVRAWLFPAVTPAIGGSLGLLLAMAVAGTLFVIPTAGEVPILQTLAGFGLGPGPAGALLLTLPAASLPSLVMLARAFPVRALLAVAAAVAASGLVAGLAAMALGLRL